MMGLVGHFRRFNCSELDAHLRAFGRVPCLEYVLCHCHESTDNLELLNRPSRHLIANYLIKSLKVGNQNEAP